MKLESRVLNETQTHTSVIVANSDFLGGGGGCCKIFLSTFFFTLQQRNVASTPDTIAQCITPDHTAGELESCLIFNFCARNSG